MFDINIIISEYDYKLIIATVYSFDYCSLITVLFHMIFKINHQNPEILNYFCDIQVFIHLHRLIIT